jgi:hypothetical protein
MGESTLRPAAVCEAEAVVFIAEILGGRFDHGAIDTGFQGALFASGFQ